jgi:hypothetical protein
MKALQNALRWSALQREGAIEASTSPAHVPRPPALRPTSER